MVGEAGIEMTFKTPVCALCGKVYDDTAMRDDFPFNEGECFYGTYLKTNKKTWLGKEKRIKVELCHRCMTVVERIRNGGKV